MKHLTDEQIVLHCYGDAADGAAIDRHLQTCPQCRLEFEKVKSLLAEIPPVPVPEPPAYLEEKIWLNVRDRLPQKQLSPWQHIFSPARWIVVAAVAVLVIAAFIAGRYWPSSGGKQPQVIAKVDPNKILLVAVGDHLERSQILLIEIMNTDAGGSIDLSDEQKQARNLLDSNRLYRLSAQRDGDPAVARVLDDLERVLTEIANGPSELSPQDLKQIRERIQSQDLLFKIHVIDSNVQRREPMKGAGPETQRL